MFQKYRGDAFAVEAGLLANAYATVFQKYRGDAFASKPAPTQELRKARYQRIHQRMADICSPLGKTFAQRSLPVRLPDAPIELQAAAIQA